MVQRLEVSKSLIATLQKEIHSQAEQIESLQESLGTWQERCDQAEHLVGELRERLTESHTQGQETSRVIKKEMEKVKEYMANHEALQEQKQSLETELRDKTKECAELRAQRQKVEREKDHLEKEVQSLRTCVEERTVTERIVQADFEQQLTQVAQAQRERLTAVSLQLEEYTSRISTEHQEQLQELEALKKILSETEKWVEMAQTIHLKVQEDQELHKNVGRGSSKEETEIEKLEKGMMMEGSPETDGARMGEESIPIVIKYLKQEWSRWASQHTEELNGLRRKSRETGLQARCWGTNST
ncbi:centrosome-associated protein CEP250-like [Alligator mississippiensis]|uniref:centrosome-associated protein CEP250-like n=1 Tax=Alligator mississippiensis TaxID=8496 RepID=UPI0028777651|nr:centrosome-associated protein CEP250-like [Alligator mississippiensis]